MNPYQHLLSGWDDLPPGLRAAHTVPLKATGEFDVSRGKGWLANRLADMFRLPNAGERQAVRLTIEVSDDQAKWIRIFNGRPYPATLQWAANGKLLERAGAATYVFGIVATNDAIDYRQERFRLLGIPIPKALSMHVSAKVTPDGDGWHVEVTIKAPFVGVLCRYAGNMRTE